MAVASGGGGNIEILKLILKIKRSLIIKKKYYSDNKVIWTSERYIHTLHQKFFSTTALFSLEPQEASIGGEK